MKRTCYSALLIACLLLGWGTTTAQNSASWEVWSDNGNLSKLSDNSTDSVSFARTPDGRTITLAFEVRTPFDGRATRRLQLVIPNFTGVGNYTPVVGSTTFWENFSQTKTCDCMSHISNSIVVTRYDSARSEIAGTFTFRCNSFATGTATELFSRIRNGVFEYNGAGKVVLEFTPKDTVNIGELMADTTFTIAIQARLGTTLTDGVAISVNDKTASPSEFFTSAGTTANGGLLNYTVNFKKSSPSGDYAIKFYGEKAPSKSSDTTTVLIRYGKRYYHYKCAGIEILEFDAGEGKEWKPISEGSPIIKSDGAVLVGGVIKMEGPVRINTTAGAERVFIDGGRVFIPNVSFAGEAPSDFDLTQNLSGFLPLPDCNGLIELAAEAASKKLSKKLPGGAEITLSKFSIINRPDAKGIQMEASLSLSNARTGCETVVDSSGGFDITDPGRQKLTIGLAVTNTNGFENLSFKASSIALTSAVCAKEISVSADFVNAVYGLGGKVEFPIKGNRLTLGGAVVFKTNPAAPSNEMALDSINISGEISECFPIGSTPLCFKSLTLAAGGLSLPTWNGSNYSATLLLESIEQRLLTRVPWLKQFTGSLGILEVEGVVTYRHPLQISGAVTTRILKIEKISKKNPWQLQGTYGIALDLNNSLTFSGPHKFGHLGGEDYMLDGTGSVSVGWNPNISFSGNLTGSISIPTPGEDILELPVLGSTLRFLKLSGFIPQVLGSGSASMLVSELAGVKMSATADVSQNPISAIRSFGIMNIDLQVRESVQFSMRHDTIPVNTNRVNGKGGDAVQGMALAVNELMVDADVDRVFAVVSGQTKAPASYFVDPSGTRYDTTSADSMVQKFATPNGEMTMWTLVAPKVGKWILNIPSVTPTDELEVTANRKPKPFALNATQSGKMISVTWDAIGSTSEDVIRLFLDTDTTGTDGVLIAEAPSKDAMYQFPLSDEFTNCRYRVYGTRVAGSQPIVSSYAPGVITGSSPVPSPLQVIAYSTATGKATVTWRMAAGTAVAGFVVMAVDSQGVETVLATTYSDDRRIDVQIVNYDTKQIVIMAFNEDGIRSCRTEAVQITTDVSNDPVQFASNSPNILVVPNPTTDVTTIRFNMQGALYADVEIVNSVGQRVFFEENIVVAGGRSTLQWNASNAPSGTYFVRIKTDLGYSNAIVSVAR